jgi:glycosyltransferase involved in cell wall biosynthesis
MHMRILKVTQGYYPFWDYGGPVVKVRALARHLARRGHAITVLTADLGMAHLPGTDGFAQQSRCGWEGRPDGIESVYLRTLARYRAITINPRVADFCRQRLSEFDIVHIYGLYDLLGPVVAYFCRRSKIPYVIEPMGMYRPIDRSFRLKKLWHRSLGRKFWRDASQIVATSEMEHRELLGDVVPEDKLVVRYNGLDNDSETDSERFERGRFRAKLNVSSQEPLVLFLGRLIPRKGADLLIRAFARACPKIGKLVIAGPEGNPGYVEYLKRCARESGVDDRVLCVGPVYEADKQSLLADADVFVLPSRYENFANAAAEAIAHNVPVIVSKSCGIGPLVDGRAGLVVGNGTEELSDALAKLLQDRPLYTRLQLGCSKVVEQLSWDRLAGQMEGYYEKAIAEDVPVC